MNQPKAIFKSVLWNQVGKTLEYVFMYVTSVCAARALGVHENGVYAGIVSFSQLLMVLSSAGLETSLNKHIPQLHGESQLEQTRFIVRRALALRILVFAIVAAILVAVNRLWTDVLPVNISTYLWLLLAFTGIRSLIPLLAIVLTAQLQTALTARLNLTARLLELVLVIVVASHGLTVDALLMIFVGTGIGQLAAYLVFASSNVRGGEQTTDIRPLLAFGAVFWVNTGVDYFLGRHGDILFLSLLLPEPSQASLYDVSYSVVQVGYLALTVGFGGVTFATFARLAASSPEGMNRFYGFLVRLTSLLTIPLYAFLLFHGQSIVSLLYSKDFSAAVPLIQGMAVFRMCSRLFAGGENAEYVLSKGSVGPLVSIGIAAAAVNISLDVLLIPRMGGWGAVVGNGFANLLANALGAWLVYRFTRAKIQLGFWFQLSCGMTAASAVAHMICLMVAPDLIILRLGCFSVLAVLVLGLLRPLLPADVAWIRGVNESLGRVLLPFSRHDLGA